MMWAFDKQGGFIVRSNNGNWAYAYPTSPHAVAAARKNKDAMIALAMARKADADAEWLPADIINRMNAYLKDQFYRCIDFDQRVELGLN